jgi:hypothetical protein
MGRAFSKFRSSDFGKGGPAVTGDTVWLEVRRDTARLVRAFTYAVLAVVVTLCVIVGLLNTAHVAAPGRFFKIGLFVVYLSPLLVLLWVIAYYRSLSWIALSLGTDGLRFSLRRKNVQVVESALLGEVRTDGEFLLIGRRLVPLHHVYRAAYDMDRLRTEFIGCLPHTALLPRNALMWRALRAGNHGIILVILVICIVVFWKVLRMSQ